MSARQRVKDLTPNVEVDSYFVVDQKRMYKFRQRDGQYLSVVLKDATGSVDGKMWDNAEEAAADITDGDVVFVTGRTQLYRKTLQVTIKSLRLARVDEYDPAELAPTGEVPVETTMTRVREAVMSVSSEPLRCLLGSFFLDDDFLRRFCQAPAAKTYHHGFIGGMGEHTATLLELAETVCRLYPRVDRDLMITGVLLHDIGKLVELDCRATIEYTDAGRLLGHIAIGMRMVEERMAGIPDFPEQLRLRVLHILASHHGEFEFGSPRRPKTPEAIAVHAVDNLDAKLTGFFTLMDKYSDSPERRWTDYESTLGRYLYLAPPDLHADPDLAEELEQDGG